MRDRLGVLALAVLLTATVAEARAPREEHEHLLRPPVNVYKKNAYKSIYKNVDRRTGHTAYKPDSRVLPRNARNETRVYATQRRPETKPRENAPAGSEASSAMLEENLNRVGRRVGANEAAHHIVAGDDPRAEEARRILERAGIGINDAINGVGLPKNSDVSNPSHEAVHSKLHTDAYYKKINQIIEAAAKRGTVRDTLKDLARQLENGGLR